MQILLSPRSTAWQNDTNLTRSKRPQAWYNPQMPIRIAAPLVLGLVLTGLTTAAQCAEVSWLEDFAVGPDRAKAIQQLVPGTPDHYYYHCLWLQHQKQFDEAEKQLATWIQQHGRNAQTREIEHRQRLLRFPHQSDTTWKYLTQVLGVRFDHQQEHPDRAPDLPTAIDDRLLDRDVLTRRAFDQQQGLAPFHDSALPWLAQQSLDSTRRREWLTRVKRPDIPGVLDLVIADLREDENRGFGSLEIHSQLLLEQLDTLSTQLPQVRKSEAFVTNYVLKLRPAAEVQIDYDLTDRAEYLQRLATFVETLDPVHNSLKAHVLYHQLAFDITQKRFDRNRFLTYLQLPRTAPYMRVEWLRKRSDVPMAELQSTQPTSITGLPPVGNDEPLVRKFLDHFLASAPDRREFAPFIDEHYLKRVFAESKLTRGIGDAKEWNALLDPAELEHLRGRIDLEFSPHAPQFFARDSVISLDLHVKNVPSLLVKIYEVNALNYYRRSTHPIGPDMELDGLVPNYQKTIQYEEPPLRRVDRTFTFPELTRPGVYVIDFIGNGRSSRAVVHKGDLQIHTSVGELGHKITVLDEQHQTVSDAQIWLDGHRFEAEKDGTIVVPFTHKPASTQIIVQQGSLAVMRPLEHKGEQFDLHAALTLERESLITGANAPILVSAQLRLNGFAIPLQRLEQAQIQIDTIDREGITSSQTIPSLQLHSDAETVVPFRVPAHLATIHVTLKGTVHGITTDEPIPLSVTRAFQVNAIDATDHTAMLLLEHTANQYELHLRGKTGEPLAQRPIQLELSHRDFVEPIRITVKSDDRGLVPLGRLAEILSLKASSAGAAERTWTLKPPLRRVYPSLITTTAGEVIRIPLTETLDSPLSGISLLEVKQNQFIRSRAQSASVEGRELLLRDLPGGEYDLRLPGNPDTIRILVIDGPHDHDLLRDGLRTARHSNDDATYLALVQADAAKLSIHIRHAKPTTRVHIVSTHFVPAFDPFPLFQLGRLPVERGYRTWEGNHFAEGRSIGDEYQYILDRKLAHKFPGILLRRPELLLRPWELSESQSNPLQEAAGEAFGAAPPPAAAAMPRAEDVREVPAGWTDVANVDFLPTSAFVAVNLRANEKGVVDVPLEKLRAHSHLSIVLIDGEQVEVQQIARPSSAWQPNDLRLANSFEATKHRIRLQKTSVLKKGDSLTIPDATSSRYRIYNTLEAAFEFLTTLQPDSRLAEFSFLANWNDLDPKSKSEKYNMYACHELDLFLFRKDRDFFQQVVRPHLEHKPRKAFLDDWLLERDLTPYFESWRYARLNVVERILLGQRIDNERAAMRQLVRNQFDSLPLTPQVWDRLFQTALAGRAASTRPGGQVVSDYSFYMGFGGDSTARSSKNAPQLENLADAPSEPSAPGAVEQDGVTMGKLLANTVNGGTLHMGQDSRSSDLTAARESLKRRGFFQAVDKTKQWGETYYDHLRLADSHAELIPLDPAWRDFANSDPQQPFLPTTWLYGFDSRHEVLLMLAILDLPFQADTPAIEVKDNQVHIHANGPTYVFHESFESTDSVVRDSAVLVNQRYFDPSIRSEMVNGQPRDKYLNRDDFVIHHVYGCQVNVSNSASTPQVVRVLLQVPAGAIAVQGGRETQVLTLELAPFSAQKVEYFFYFPKPGQFEHYPVHVFDDGRIFAFAPPETLSIAAKPATEDPESWGYVSQYGTPEQVLTFLHEKNIHGINLTKIAFRMRDRDFFQKVIPILRRRHAFDATLWSYALHHQLVDATREWLGHQSSFLQECGSYLDSELITIDAKDCYQYEHLEFHPLTNSRSHRLGERWQIANPEVHRQYEHLLKTLSYKSELTSQDWLEVTYYLLLQDRFDDAIQAFARVNSQDIEEHLQYDYMQAYIDCLKEQPQHARAIAQKYVDYPVPHWRDAFIELNQMLEEVDQNRGVDARSQPDNGANAVPTVDLRQENGQIRLDYTNVDRARLNYYVMDLELLFSRNPFLQSFNGDFATIRPNETQELVLKSSDRSVLIDLPDSLRRKNVLVEVEAGQQVRSLPIYSHVMSIQINENQGQLFVQQSETGKPIAKVYIKAYAEMQDGSISFYKDGYTDLRGRFDYATLSTSQLDQVKRFALLIMSEDHGATVREVKPPKQ